jgi:NitT/TauT family transport system ATP-binding protein
MEPALRDHVAAKEFQAAGSAPPRHVLQHVGIDEAAGERMALTGPSGCGKTTLLNLIAGLDKQFEGRIDRPPATRLAYVFQEPRLLPWRTVEQNLELVLPRSPERASRIRQALGEVGLDDALHTFASRLSLGMARRVALARAFVLRPDLLLLDEPFVSLDEPTARRLRLLLADLLARHRITTLFVTHHLGEAIMLADRILVLSGSPASIADQVRIELSPAERRDPRAIEKLRAELAAERRLGFVEESDQDLPAG